MNQESILDRIFNTPEKEVEYFSDVVAKKSTDLSEKHQSTEQGSDTESGIAQRISREDVAKVKKTAQYKKEQQGLIEINHGWHADSYVWHIRPFHPKKPWAVSIKRVCFAVGTILNEHLPQDRPIDIHLPNPQWQIEELTIKANDVGSHWSVTQEIINRVTMKFFEVLNTLV